jgi:hypothetical protein
MELYLDLLKFTFKICRVFLLTNLGYLNFWMRLLSNCSLFAKLTVIAYLPTLSLMLDSVDFKYYFNRLLEMLELVDSKAAWSFLYKNTCNCPQLPNVSKTGGNISPLQ